MNDYRDLFGGMCGGALLLAVYIACWGLATSAHGAVASDGISTVTDDGYVQPEPVPLPYIEDSRVHHPVKSGDKVLICDLEFVLVSSADWSRLTNTIDKVERIVERRHTAELRTDEGRQRWHGELIDRTATPDGRAVVYTYADGFTYTEKARAEIKQSPAVQKVRRAAPKPRPVKVEYDAPARLRAKQEAANARPAVKEVNAVFTAGGKVKVEGE